MASRDSDGEESEAVVSDAGSRAESLFAARLRIMRALRWAASDTSSDDEHATADDDSVGSSSSATDATAAAQTSSAHAAMASLLASSSVGRWEDDADVAECRLCRRRFTLFFRKHHCRRCGRIVCATCSASRVVLSDAELIIDPSIPEMRDTERAHPSRVCDVCVTAYGLRVETREEPPDTARWISRLGFASRAADLSCDAETPRECPVCERDLRTLPSDAACEAHIAACLERGAPAANPTRFLTSQLPADSPLIGSECIICMEEFEPADSVARLMCLCCFHQDWYVCDLTDAPVYNHGSTRGMRALCMLTIRNV